MAGRTDPALTPHGPVPAPPDPVSAPGTPLAMRVAIAAALVGVAGLAVALVSGALGALASLVVIPPAVAAFASARTTAVISAVALGLVALAGVPYDAFAAPHTAVLVAVALVGIVAVALAADRERRERSAAYSSFLGEA